MAENTHERLIRYLQDAHATELGIMNALEGMFDDALDPEVSTVFNNHIALTRTQAERLEARLKELGESPSGGKGMMNSLLGKVSDMVNAAHDEYDKSTQNLIKAYSTEHLERGMYESMAAYADAIGDTTTAQLARELQAEEEATAELIFPLIQTRARAALAGAEGTGGAYTA
jgi:ferritin-like metal-binding protein YciE